MRRPIRRTALLALYTKLQDKNGRVDQDLFASGVMKLIAEKFPCGHRRLIRSGKFAGWLEHRGDRTISCLDCGMFWLWHPKGSYFSAGGIHGGVWTRKLEKRKKRIERLEK